MRVAVGLSRSRGKAITLGPWNRLREGQSNHPWSLESSEGGAKQSPLVLGIVGLFSPPALARTEGGAKQSPLGFVRHGTQLRALLSAAQCTTANHHAESNAHRLAPRKSDPENTYVIVVSATVFAVRSSASPTWPRNTSDLAEPIPKVR
jgi:hypothetical protein